MEIERKFLVRGDFKQNAFSSDHIIQGYLSTNSRNSIRVRIREDRAYLTIKGKSFNGGLSRYEWEKEIPAEDARELLKLAEPGIIEKIRWCIKADDGKHIWEVDEFLGENEGLVVAEVELGAEDEKFSKPGWLGEEVTGKKCYYNSMLREFPFKLWK